MFAKNILFLDLGSSCLKGILVNEKKFSILAKATQANSGITNGQISNANLFQESLRALIKNLEKTTRSHISSTVLLISGNIVKYKMLVSNEIQVNSIINEDKMRMIDEKIQGWTKNNNSLLVRATPIEYKLNKISVEEPFGMYADTLKFTYFLAYAQTNQLGNIVYMLEKQGLDIIDIIPSSYCNAALHLQDDEKKLGSLIFDLGAHHINWAHYAEGKPLSAGVINFGSEIFTHKIAKSLRISINEAREIKHKHGAAQLTPHHFCSWTEFTKDGNSEFILESEIVRKIMPETNLMITEMQRIINSFSGKVYLAVLCGSAAWLNKLSDTIQKGSSISIKLSPSAHPEYDALNGAIIEYQQQYRIKRKKLVSKALHWLKNNV